MNVSQPSASYLQAFREDEVLAAEGKPEQAVIAEHRNRHPLPEGSQYRWIWISSEGDQKMVACIACGQRQPYDPQRHSNVEDID